MHIHGHGPDPLPQMAELHVGMVAACVNSILFNKNSGIAAANQFFSLSKHFIIRV
jgi:hypothetical protein